MAWSRLVRPRAVYIRRESGALDEESRVIIGAGAWRRRCVGDTAVKINLYSLLESSHVMPHVHLRHDPLGVEIHVRWA
jgi:hypothetical protein